MWPDWAAITLLQDDREGQELRVELALAELGKHRQRQAQAAAAADAAAGIDAFEMTLKRLGGSEGGAEQDREGECHAWHIVVCCGALRNVVAAESRVEILRFLCSMGMQPLLWLMQR